MKRSCVSSAGATLFSQYKSEEYFGQVSLANHSSVKMLSCLFIVFFAFTGFSALASMIYFCYTL